MREPEKERSYPSQTKLYIAAGSMEAQREANDIERQNIELKKQSNSIAKISVIASVIAAIAAIIAATFSISTNKTIELIIKTNPM